MQDVKELILMLQHASLPLLQQPPDRANENPDLFRLLKGVESGHYLTDADAAAGLFPGASAGHSGFYELKSTLRESLIASIEQFITTLEQHTDLQKVQFECQKLWLNVRNLSGPNANEPALMLADRLLQIAEKFDLTLLCMDIALYLRIQYCLRKPNSAQCAGADLKYQHFRAVYDAEFEAEKSYISVMALAVGNPAGREQVRRRAQQSSAVLQPLMRTFQRPKLCLYGYLIELMQHTAALDFAQALHSCDKALRFFQDRPYLARDPLQVFHYQRLICCIHLRQFEAGRESALDCLALAGDNFFNLLKINELYLILALHTKQYEEAFRIFSGVRDDPQFGYLPVGHAETWEVIGAYLSFLQSPGFSALAPAGQTRHRWDILPDDTFSSPETRLNVSRISIHVLSLLQQRRYEEVSGLAKRMDDYCAAYLDHEPTRRSYLLLKMLAQIGAGQCQRTSIIPLAAGFLAQLKSTPLALANQTEELELLPYEDLWNLALDLLNARN